ncbi:YjbE family putative metal transport protein [Sphingobium yanoikuyae]|jgi:YjbE family integral membrane protein|uniref:YjbE family putative metal transport protein n=1 Tax=Sphingobium yanoikuyae TaxID=13690 RepID=A0A6M4G4Q7_SPHYA|nr:YjbE family putative metal transport protein [Sphingobium yanoikuyae]MDH2134865.1 YjbE family putative metal transport protein [Sphingobium yanoikuyae]MDH2152676.1 YjbE family putative metal transport protein [Sphingobium yanoikuyae]MDH2166478.1 YjbE family putative metal transport protein [Sphingobium yanoikuyae]QJR01243.1 YjbE family putative metal transport protein [Sphingobium yanoikuyae]
MNDIWTHIVADFSNLGSPSALAAFGQVVLIDIMLAADNAIVVGALAAGLPPASRRKVIAIGVIAALVLRIAFALLVTQLMQLVGLVFAGGLLLVWVGWKMWRELRAHGEPEDAEDIAGKAAPKGFAQAAWAVAIADVSMSLDNVLAVAGAAREHPGILVIGLVLSVALMGVAANLLARVIERYRAIAYFGLVVILYVAGKMIYEGAIDPATGLITLF